MKSVDKNCPPLNLLANMRFLILVTNDQKCSKTQSGKLVGLTLFWGSVLVYVEADDGHDHRGSVVLVVEKAELCL